MQRDMDLARAILIQLEAHPDADGPNAAIQVDGYEDDAVSYHVKLLYEAGFIHATDMTSMSGSEWFPGSLTWPGHEFLTAVRNETVWAETKDTMKKNGGALPFEIIQAVATAALSKVLGL